MKRYSDIPAGLPPYIGNEQGWCSINEAAIVFGRAAVTIRLWLKNGTFAEFGIKTYRDPTGMWHINVPKPGSIKSKKGLSGQTAAVLTG